MSERGFKVRAIGEVAIRCADLDPMVAFYGDVIGLELLEYRNNDKIAFLRVAPGFEGHTSVLALFHHDVTAAGNTAGSASAPLTGPRSSLHHLALSLPWAEQDAVIAWYDKLAQPYHIETFDWIGWRGIFTRDPEGNTVELVAKNPNWKAGGSAETYCCLSWKAPFTT